jgi:hypothetical protein
VYFHDPVEVDPVTSWTGLCAPLRDAVLVDIRQATNSKVVALFDYARPDAVITVDEQPVVSIEQTQMNPSGHNIPQRFSFQVRAAELGIPSILYYPEYSRRTFSDPNVRYLNIRVPLGQIRLSRLYKIPALSVFWPTDPVTKLPTMQQQEHKEIASLVALFIANSSTLGNLLNHPTVKAALEKMAGVASQHKGEYRNNPSVRQLMPQGFQSARVAANASIDPPIKAKLAHTSNFLAQLESHMKLDQEWVSIKRRLLQRPMTIIFPGTANQAKNDSEHPWPGYLSLIDILYARTEGGQTPRDRNYNLVYGLSIPSHTALTRLNRPTPPTATFIVDTFADLLIFADGVVCGRPIRGNTEARVVLEG